MKVKNGIDLGRHVLLINRSEVIHQGTEFKTIIFVPWNKLDIFLQRFKCVIYLAVLLYVALHQLTVSSVFLDIRKIIMLLAQIVMMHKLEDD